MPYRLDTVLEGIYILPGNKLNASRKGILCCPQDMILAPKCTAFWTYVRISRLTTRLSPAVTYNRRWICACLTHASCTQRNLFEILLNQTEIRLYLPFFDWFGTKRTSVWFQINWKMVNTIWFLFDLIRFRKYFSVCRENSRPVTWCLVPRYGSRFQERDPFFLTH